jgi:hypothetical protein
MEGRDAIRGLSLFVGTVTDVDFENIVIPLMAARSKPGKWRHGSGFLVRTDGQLFLVTAAHLADYDLAPRSDWSLWSKEIFLADTIEVDTDDGLPKRIASFELFFEGHKGKRVPKFRYVLRPERPGTIADIILVPVQQEDLVVQKYSSFDLPQDRGPHQPGAVVTQLGRRNDFPALSVTQHCSTQQAGPVRLMKPPGEDGDSGGPVLDATGLLLGMNVGSHELRLDEAMLMSPEAIESVSKAARGVATDWPDFAPPSLPSPLQ